MMINIVFDFPRGIKLWDAFFMYDIQGLQRVEVALLIIHTITPSVVFDRLFSSSKGVSPHGTGCKFLQSNDHCVS